MVSPLQLKSKPLVTKQAAGERMSPRLSDDVTSVMISFFEEFPTPLNLSKIAFIKKQGNLYLAAPSLKEFLAIKKGIKNKYIQKVIYWPILTRSEGYWISPFAKRCALKRIFAELSGKSIPVMLDLELPTRQNPLLYLTQSPNVISNKRLLKNFIRTYGGDIFLAEYYPEGKRQEAILSILGLHYKEKRAKIIKMVYHSLHDFDETFLRKEFRRGKAEFADNFLAAYGTIYAGIHGTEPLIDPKQLAIDLTIAKEEGIKEVIIFRLGGLNKTYSKVLYGKYVFS